MTLENYIQTLNTFLANNPEARYLEVYSSSTNDFDPNASIMAEPELCHVDEQAEYFNQECLSELNDGYGLGEESYMEVNAVVC